MSSLVFLILAVAISAVGSASLWIRYRQPRKTLTSSIDHFQREMAALAPREMRKRSHARHGSEG